MHCSPIPLNGVDFFKPVNSPYRESFQPLDARFPNIHIGVEVEVEDCPKLSIYGWKWHDEPSLRSEDNSEYVTFGSILAGHLPAALDELFMAMPPTRSFSDACSTHVHVDARYWSSEQLGCLFAAYYSVEPLLFGFVGNRRRSNNYCVPWYDALLRAEFIAWERDFANISSGKYAALNFCNLRSRNKGTVEFRHWPGLADRPRFETWVLLITRLCNYASKTRYNVHVERMRQLKTMTNTSEYLTCIFGEVSEALPHDHEAVQRAVKTYLSAEVSVKPIIACVPNSPLAKRLNTTKGPKIRKRKSPAVAENLAVPAPNEFQERGR